jgi:hypothetical protein
LRESLCAEAHSRAQRRAAAALRMHTWLNVS